MLTTPHDLKAGWLAFARRRARYLNLSPASKAKMAEWQTARDDADHAQWLASGEPDLLEDLIAKRQTEREAAELKKDAIDRACRLVRLAADSTDEEVEAAEARHDAATAAWHAKFDHLWPAASIAKAKKRFEAEQQTYLSQIKEAQLSVVPFPKPATAPPRYLFETLSDLRKLPAAKWLAEGWFPEQGVGLIYGEYGSGKSFIGFDLLLHLVYGLAEWHGVKLPGIPTDVLLIAREGARGFEGRVDAFKAHHGIADDTDRIVFMRSPANFGDVTGFEELKAAIRVTGRQFKVVMVDTVGRALPGEDFYDPKSITRFMEHLQQLGEISNGLAIGVHHSNKSGDVFGSVYFGASSDFMFVVTREGDPRTDPLRRGKINCEKMKDGPSGWGKRLSYQAVADSLVLASVTDGGDIMGKADRKKLSADDKLAFQALSEALRAKGQLRAEMSGRSVTIDEWLDQCFKIGGVSPDAAKPKRDLHRRQVNLLDQKLILIQDQLVRIIDQTSPAGVAIPMMAAPGGPLPPIPFRPDQT